MRIHLAIVGTLGVLAVAGASNAAAAGTIGTSFPAGFPAITDASLGTPVIGFGAAGSVSHTPVIFVHGNNDTPFPTLCNPLFGGVQRLAQFFAEHGYAPSELWALGYQGNQCDLFADQTKRSGVAHSTLANVSDLRAFVLAVLAYTHAAQVDIVAHSLGVTLAREWMREDQAYPLVRRFVAIDGPNHGIVDCSPSFANYWQIRWLGGFTPQSALCQEYGSPDTPFLSLLNRGSETPGPTRVLVIRNADASFVYFSKWDGFIAPVPSQDYLGRPHDFSQSATLQGSEQLDLTGQGRYDRFLHTAHLGILASPDMWNAALAFLTNGSYARSP